VDQTDLNALTQYLAGDVLWSTDQVNQADLNKDGQVDARDLALLQQRLGIRPLTAKAKSFEVGVAQVIPEWVRGNWTFTSQVLETGGLSRMGSPPQDEEISLPGTCPPIIL
jgi:hypothetical protein